METFLMGIMMFGFMTLTLWLMNKRIDTLKAELDKRSADVIETKKIVAEFITDATQQLSRLNRPSPLDLLMDVMKKVKEEREGGHSDVIDKANKLLNPLGLDDKKMTKYVRMYNTLVNEDIDKVARIEVDESADVIKVRINENRMDILVFIKQLVKSLASHAYQDFPEENELEKLDKQIDFLLQDDSLLEDTEKLRVIKNIFYDNVEN
jgi:hypothetical protein